MTQVNGTGTKTEQEARYETPAFAPGVAFSWTLRSAEIARRKRTGNGTIAKHAARYETPAFAPGVAFSWTLRSAEIARHILVAA
jgi:hypothetical protein